MHDATLAVAEAVGKNPIGAYFIIYIVTIFLGNISAFVSFWIIFEAHFGIVGFLVLALTFFLSDMTGDLMWYSLGRSLRGTRFGLWVETHMPGHAKAEAMVRRKGRQWLFLSKFVLGFAPPVVFSIGWSGMDLKTFYRNSLLSILLWLPILMGLSYCIVSGLAPLAATNFRKLEWVALGGFVLFVILDYAIAKGVKMLADRFLETDAEDENLTDRREEDYHKDR
jgi:membrane protein DedA with SNARE-associated domain